MDRCTKRNEGGFVTNHTFTIQVGAPDDLSTQAVGRLLNRILRNGLDAAPVSDPDDDPDTGLIEQMSFEDAKPVSEEEPDNRSEGE
jgi:hypothetical protein